MTLDHESMLNKNKRNVRGGLLKSFEELTRKQMNESNEWVEDSSCYFVGVFINEYPSQAINISETMSLYTGFEFNVFTE